MKHGGTMTGVVRLGLGVSVSLASVVAGCSASGRPFGDETTSDAATTTDAPEPSAESGSDASADASTSGDAGEACGTGQISCASDAGGTYCASTKSDNANCGACGNVCSAGLVCSGGACVVSCPGTEVNCGGSCIQPATDEVHCGASVGCGMVDGGLVDGGPGSGVACGAGSMCAGGGCIPSCLAPLIICGSACIDPRIDPLHCGTCSSCSTLVSNATNPVCRASACAVGTCASGFNDCNAIFGDGCESNSLTDNANCGFCGNACAAGLSCTSGACMPPATLFFDSLSAPGSTSTRTAGDSCGTMINVTTTQNISAIAVKNNLNASGNVRFMVWTHPAHLLIYLSGPKAFGTGDSWKQSEDLSLVLAAGQSYDIGGISDVAGLWDFDTTAENSSGIATALSNPNFSNFTTPTVAGAGGADCGIRLFH